MWIRSLLLWFLRLSQPTGSHRGEDFSQFGKLWQPAVPGSGWLCPYAPQATGKQRPEPSYLGASYSDAPLLQIQRLEELLYSLWREHTWTSSEDIHTPP